MVYQHTMLRLLHPQRSMADFFEAALKKTKNYSLLSNWLIGEISAYLNKEADRDS